MHELLLKFLRNSYKNVLYLLLYILFRRNDSRHEKLK